MEKYFLNHDYNTDHNICCTKKWSFPLKISSVKVTESAENWINLVNKSLMENLIFYAVIYYKQYNRTVTSLKDDVFGDSLWNFYCNIFLFTLFPFWKNQFNGVIIIVVTRLKPLRWTVPEFKGPILCPIRCLGFVVLS